MAICITDPIEKQKFEKLVSVVGQKEAARDYFEQNEMVRTPSVVLQKLENRRAEKADDTFFTPEDFVDASESIVEVNTEDVPLMIEGVINARNSSISEAAINDMSSRLGVPYNFISESQAIAMGAGNAKGFYEAGQVYFVREKFTPETVFHEFMHPVIKSMAIDNPELFNKLYNDVMAKDWGKTINSTVREDNDFKDLDESNIRQEVVVQGLTHMNENQEDNRTLLDKFLYQIRQFLRKMLGKKINVAKLDLNTSLEDLIDMLNKAEEFQLNKDFLKADDVRLFQKDYSALMTELNKKSAVTAQNMINEFRGILKKQVGLMQKDRGIYTTISEDLINDENTGLLQEMLKGVKEISTEIGSSKDVLTIPLANFDFDNPQLMMDRVNQFIEVMSKSNAVFDNYNAIIDSIGEVTEMDSLEMNQLQAISVIADKWSLYFEAHNKGMAKSHYENIFPEGGAVQNTIAELKKKSDKLKTSVDNKRYNIVADITYKLVKEESADIEKFYTDQLQALFDKGAVREYNNVYYEYHGITVEDQNTIDRLELEKKNDPNNELDPRDELTLQKLKTQKLTGHEVTRDGIRALLENEGPDAGAVNSYIESYLDNQDKIVGGFFMFMHNQLKDVGGNANRAQAEFQAGLKPLLREAGLDWLTHIGEGNLGRVVGRRVNIGKKVDVGDVAVINETNPEASTIQEIEDWEEWQFLSNFSGHERVISELQLDIAEAQKKWNRTQSAKNEEVYRTALEKYEQFKIDYMHQDMIPEFYKAEHLLRDEIGIKAKAARDKFFEELNQMQGVRAISAIDIESMDAIKQKWREYRYMYSLTDIYGNPKTGEELEIAERLNEYRDQTKDFFEWKDTPNKFQDAYDAFISTLEADGLKPADTKYQNKRNEWLEHNTVVEVTQDYFELRTKFLEERSELLKPLTDVNAAIKDVGPIYKEIYALSAPSRDEQGHYDGNTVTAEVQELIKEKHEEIEEARYDLYTSLGLTRAELDEYTSILSFHSLYGKYENGVADERKVNDYRDRMSDGLTAAPFNISPIDVKRIMELDAILSNLTRSNATRHYVQTIDDMLDVPATQVLYEEFLDEMGVDKNDGDVLAEKNVEALLNPIYSEYLDAFLRDNSAFATWFNNNHYLAERTVADKDGNRSVQEVYVKTSLWSYSAPKSREFYKGFALQDSAGNTTALLEHEGLPRVPNMEYKERVVKDEYVTKKIEKDYVDADGRLILANVDARTGKWLPRTMEQGAKNADYINDEYMDMFHNNRATWNVIEYVKNQHLKNQETMERGQRLGISFPRMRAGSVETIRRGYLYRGGESNVLKGIAKGRMFESMARIFRREADDIEIGMKSRDKKNKLDVYETLTRPVSGTYDLHENEVSTNIFGTMHDYAYSVEYFKSLRKINSFSQALKDMVREKAMPEEASALAKKAKQYTAIDVDKYNSKRALAISNIVEQYFEGVAISGVDFAGKKGMAQIMNHVSGSNSRKWFAFTEIASATNALQGKTQMYQKTWDKRFPSMKNLSVGEAKSTRTMAQLMRHTYSKKTKPVQLQLMNVMNAIPGHVKQMLSETSSRNIMQDIAKGQVGYISRTNMQNQVEVQGFYGMLDKAKYKFRINGKGKKVSIDEAVHLVNGIIETVPGVPEEYRISYDSNGDIVLGKKIKEVMSVHEGYLHKTIGMAGATSEGELLSRALVGKYMFALFKWMPAMLMDRYAVRGAFSDILKGRARRRVNWYTKSVEYGRVIGAFDMIRQFTNSGFKHVNAKEVADALQVATWFVIALALNYIIKAITFNVGDDPDDDRNEFSDFDPQAKGIFQRLKGAANLPDIPFMDPARVANDAEPFDYVDHFKMQGLRLALRLNRENNTFMPMNFDSGGGIIPILYNMGRFRSPLQEGVLEDYAKLGNLVRQEFGDHPEKNEIGVDAGPYIWQQKGESKWLKWYMDYRGFTGSMPDPARGIKGEAMNL